MQHWETDTMLRALIARMTAEHRQTFPRQSDLREAEAVVILAGTPKYAGSVAPSWGPFVDRMKWTIWDWEGQPVLQGGVGSIGGRILQHVRQGDEIAVLYSSRKTSVLGAEPIVQIAGREYRLPGNLNEVQSFEFGECGFRWQRVGGWPLLHLHVPSAKELLPFLGLGYDLWKGAYFRASGGWFCWL
jgi:hypothetical protein